MGVVGTQRQANFTAHINLRGTNTTVNGATIKGIWQDAGVQRIQNYLNENDWGKASYEVRFPAAVLAAPYSLKNGMEVYRQGLNHRALVRHVTFEESDAAIIQVNVLCVETTE